MISIKQFVPSEFCLKCQGCCRFAEDNSVWLPCLLDEEIQDLLDKDIPAVTITLDRKIVPKPNHGGDGFVCAFLGESDNACKIYAMRPFECQLYPFLITLRGKKVILTVDLNCPYIEKNVNTGNFKEYVRYLEGFLNAPAQVELLRNNPHIIQAYQDVLDIVELKSHDETQ
ncbi:MAG TPA: YkgJ family cysteine cluster protein [Candidatus Omnitrophota bacterium]|nr:YkgJ family cysteine cluster protein [Candidatus Omnitrophota bacterium]HPT06991.1 YkgJ family cysteine cluster protein [Candidatus Omnitrophota bacterium]